MKTDYITDYIDSIVGKIPRVSTTLTARDQLGAAKVRMSFGRSNYKVQPGLYAVGSPDANSLVLVSANYKLSFGALRKELTGLNLWIMVIDTKGINVWCAAGKGTFGTEEIISRVESVNLKDIVKHRKLVLPQLGAPGVAAHEVKKNTGFTVHYGPVRSCDIPAYIKAGLLATPEMRMVHFTLYDRFILTPVEIVFAGKYILVAAACLFLLAGLSRNSYSSDLALSAGGRSVLYLLLAFISGAFLGPLLLPWLPGRSFSFKGFFVGAVMFVLLVLLQLGNAGWADIIAWMLVVPAISSFITMNFTGASTYTSLSGVRKEMKVAVPLQAVAIVAGAALWVAGRFL